MSHLMTPEMIAQYEQMVAQGKFTGRTTLLFAQEIANLCRVFWAKTLLDYGCGRGDQYDVAHLDEMWGVDVTGYDPAVVEYRKRPEGKFDGVICVDVLEHIEEIDLPKVIRDVTSFAEKFVFFTVCTRPAKKTLPDGRNCHLTIKPQEWWLKLLSENVSEDLYYEVRWNV